MQILRRKPLMFLIVTLIYLVGLGFLKWQLHPPIGAIEYIIGGAIGVYFLDAAEVFFALSPSPFRSVIFMASFTVLSLFVVSSSGSMLSSGLVLSLYLSLLLWQLGEWQYVGNLSSWYRMVNGAVPLWVERWGFVIFVLLFLLNTYLFVRWA